MIGRVIWRNKKANGTSAKEKNYVHIEKLNLPCRYFCPFCALRLPEVYAHLLVHSYSLVKSFMLILWCEGKRCKLSIRLQWSSLSHTHTHTQTLIHAYNAHMRHIMHSTDGRSAILCWRCFFFTSKIINSNAIKQKTALNFL